TAGAGAGTGSGSAAAAPATAGFAIFVDDAQVATVSAAQLAGWPRVDTLVPDTARKLGTWELVVLDSDKPKPAEVRHPSGSYPDMVPALFPGDGGGVAFGMFDTVELAKKGKPAMREDHLKSIHIKLAQGGSHGQNDDQGGGNADPTKLVITVTTPTGTTTLTGSQLLALPREPSPNNPDQKGWRLQALLDAAGVKKFKQLVLSDASGTNLTIDKKDLDANTVPFIKLNKSGALRFRVMKKQGDGWTAAGDLRSLIAIEAK
ncbi:MAG TPA: hypothetical protein VH165_36010, partial [Kofleriaceae bacterium]|nr:hypothetical protein [Kofleriaceae bacterium]